MKLTIIGGSHGTGAQVAIAACKAGHDVTVVSRSGNVPDGTRAVVGSATDPEVARKAVLGADAVVVCVGAAKGVAHNRADVTRAIIDAMSSPGGATRLIVQSSLGAGDSGRQLPTPLRQLMGVLLAKPLADHNKQEAAVRESGLEWTIVRPTGLKNDTATGEWKVLETTEKGTLGASIPRADLAAFLIDVAEDDATIGKELGISSR